jgi:phage terminase large subunit-like protein
VKTVEPIPGRPFTLAHFKRWARGLVLDNDKPWRVEAFQAAFVGDVFAGFPECWLVVPEENTKTTLAAGLALYHGEHRPTAWVPLAAASKEQARWLYGQAEGFVLRSPRLRQVWKPQEGLRRIKGLATGPAAGSMIQVFSADDRTGDGAIPTLAILDELHRHRDLKLQRTWTGKLRKRGGQLVAISTAGEPGSEFEETRERIRQASTTTRRQGRTFVPAASEELVLHEYAVPEDGDVEDLELVKAANPFSGITVESLRRKRASPTMTLAHWRRFVCDLPTRSVTAAIAEAEWFAAGVDDMIPPGKPIWLGADLAFKYDCTALVPLWWRDADYRLLGPATILTPPRDGNSLDPDLIERAVLEIHARNPIHTVVMDPSKAEQLALWISRETGATVVERAQSNSFAAVDYATFMEALRLGQLHHTGDPGLTRHVLNATARLLPGGDTRFDRPAESRRSSEQPLRVIDALTAAAMVHSEAALSAVAPMPWAANW